MTPESGSEPTEESVIKMTHDDEYFYVSGQSYINPAHLCIIGKIS